MKRTTQFFTVDAVAFALFVLLTTTGLLVRYTLPPGSGRFRTLWGMDRHGWGQVHFWIAIGLFATLSLHVFFHWKWIVSMIKGRPREASGIRPALGLVALLALVGLAASPFLAPIEQTEGARGTPHTADTDADADAAVKIDGSMTLLEVERQTGVPIGVILDELGLPPDLPPDERLGQLRRRYQFEIHAVREVISRHAGPTE